MKPIEKGMFLPVFILFKYYRCLLMQAEKI